MPDFVLFASSLQYKMKRNFIAQIRMTSKQYEELKRRAEAHEMSLSEDIRFVLFHSL